MTSFMNPVVANQLGSKNQVVGITKYNNIYFDSRASPNINANGNFFTVSFNNPIQIPKEAHDCSVGVFSASIYFTNPNLLTGVNDLLYFVYAGNPYTFTFEQGLYSIEQLNDNLSIKFQQNSLPADLFTFTPDTATGLTVITFNYVGIQIDFTQTKTIRTLLGFNSILVPTALSVVNEVSVGNTIAQFNTYENFVIQSPELIGNGIPVNERGSGILTIVPLTAPANSLIVYTPSNILWQNCDYLIGQTLSNISLRLTTNNFDEVIMLEPWNVMVSISYTL